MKTPIDDYKCWSDSTRTSGSPTPYLRGSAEAGMALLTSALLALSLPYAMAVLLGVGPLGCYIAAAQTATRASARAVGDDVPITLWPKVRALGDRFFVRGKERLTLGGSVLRPGVGAGVPVTLIYEIPRKFRYQEGAKSIVFDGASGSLSPGSDTADAALAESLFEDMVDGLLPNIRNASLFRLLFNRGRLDDGTSKGYTGPYLDIYQAVLPLSSLPNSPKRTKHFYFDSDTQLLSRVRYFGGATGDVPVETLCENWRQMSGTFVPGTVTRSENGKVEFTFTTSSAAAEPAASDATFSH